MDWGGGGKGKPLMQFPQKYGGLANGGLAYGGLAYMEACS